MSGAALETRPAKVLFKLQYEVQFGQSIRVIGSHPTLGDWQIDAAPTMNWSPGNVWVYEAELPAGSVVEYKYVVTQSGSLHGQSWQQGNNAVLAVTPEEDRLVVVDNWSAAPGAVVVLENGEEMKKESKLAKWASEMMAYRSLALQKEVELAEAKDEVVALKSEVARLKMELSLAATAGRGYTQSSPVAEPPPPPPAPSKPGSILDLFTRHASVQQPPPQPAAQAPVPAAAAAVEAVEAPAVQPAAAVVEVVAEPQLAAAAYTQDTDTPVAALVPEPPLSLAAVVAEEDVAVFEAVVAASAAAMQVAAAEPADAAVGGLTQQEVGPDASAPTAPESGMVVLAAVEEAEQVVVTGVTGGVAHEAVLPQLALLGLEVDQGEAVPDIPTIPSTPTAADMAAGDLASAAQFFGKLKNMFGGGQRQAMP